MAKKSAKSRGPKRSPSAKRAGAGSRAAKAAKGGRRRTAGARTPAGKAKRKQAGNPPRPGKRSAKQTAKSARPAPRRGRGPAGSARKTAARGSAKTRRGGAGLERTLAQTPETGRSRKGRTNPLPTKRSTGAPSGAGRGAESSRRRLREIEEGVPTPPSSLDMDRLPSAARSGRRHLHDAREDRTETSPALTGGDVDADWQDAYAVGDEAPGGDNPTPDQDRVDEIGRALGVIYEDNEELKASDKIAKRDRHRWELDPASSEDYRDRNGNE